MTIVYCADRNIYHLLPTTINSLLSNNPDVKKIYLLIEDDTIDYIADKRIEFINCSKFDFLVRDGFNVSRKFPYMAMTRCFLSKILKEDKVLYLDVDTIVDGNISELWNTNISGNCIAGRTEKENDGYINSGVLLMNLKMIRLLNLEEYASKLLKSCRFVFPDQDVINIVFKGRIQPIKDIYNSIGRDGCYLENLVIRHFAGTIKPWCSGAKQEDMDIWAKYYVTSV